jgi:hypothetical protein
LQGRQSGRANRQGKAGRSKQCKAGRARQGKAVPRKVMQGKAEPGRARQGKAVQYRAKQAGQRRLGGKGVWQGMTDFKLSYTAFSASAISAMWNFPSHHCNARGDTDERLFRPHD